MKFNKQKKLKLKEKKGFLARLMEKKAKNKLQKEKAPVPKIDLPPPIKEKKQGITQKLDDLNEKLDIITQKKKVDKELKKKNFKLPFKVKSQLKKLATQNKVQVMLLQRNLNIKPTTGELKDGMLLIGEGKNVRIHNGSVDFMWLWNGKIPTVILPEWDLNPIRAGKLYDETVKANRIAEPQQIMIRAMEFKEAMQPQKLTSKAMIWIFIGVAVVGYALFAGG